jgi:hypothetical protein
MGRASSRKRHRKFVTYVDRNIVLSCGHSTNIPEDVLSCIGLDSMRFLKCKECNVNSLLITSSLTEEVAIVRCNNEEEFSEVITTLFSNPQE